MGKIIIFVEIRKNANKYSYPIFKHHLLGVLKINTIYKSPDSGTNAYISKARSYSSLSLEEERQLLKLYQNHQDVDAKKTLVEAQLKNVIYLAKKYSSNSISESDLIQEGTVGLLVAIDKYDLSKTPVKIFTFARAYVIREILNLLFKANYCSTVSDNKEHRKLFFNLHKESKAGLSFSKDELKRISEKHGVKIETIQKFECLQAKNVIELDCNNEVASSKNALSYDGDNPATIFEISNRRVERISRLEDAKKKLTEREKHIIDSRHFCDVKQTHESLGKVYGVSSQRIAQIEQQAKLKLSRSLLAA